MKIQTTHYRKLLEKFDIHVRSTKSLQKGNHYAKQVEHFLIWLEQRRIFSLQKVNTPLMKAYFQFLITRPKKQGEGILKPSTVNDHLSSLRMFSLRLQDENILSEGLPVPLNIRTEQESDNHFALVRQIVTRQEIREIFLACDHDMERSLIALAYGSGLRRSTLTNLLETHIDFVLGMVTVLRGKNNKTFQVPVSDFFLKVLRDYTIQRLRILAISGSRTKRFFITANGRPLSGNELNELLKEIIGRTKNAEIMDKQITLHCLRHSLATHLMDDGQSFEYVRDILGHACADTTVVYARRRKIKNYYEI